jgi:hypothetical protein
MPQYGREIQGCREYLYERNGDACRQQVVPIVLSKLEVQFDTKLNVPWWTSGADRSKARVSQNSSRALNSEVSMVKGIEHIRLNTDIESFSHGELLPHGEVPRLEIRT